jgi:CBS domain-containing protein
MKVMEAMSKKPRFCEPSHSIAVAGRTMAQVDCGVLPVVDRARVVGVITDRDICLAVTGGDREAAEIRVEEVMSAPPHTCRASDDVRHALATMRERRVRRLPVVGERGELEGLLSLDDIVLAARVLETDEFSGPFYVDIVETLKVINRRLVPAVVEPRSGRRRSRSAARPRTRGAEA